MVHRLKIRTEYFEAVKSGKKAFEVRRNDRHFKVGDTVILCELDEWHNDGFTGRRIKVEITYILDDVEFCKAGFVVFGFRMLGIEDYFDCQK